jgi:2-succinyl-5-enolpyruvyl-6-hydroxy-3-cyclohexene-1-carboxylate synthase
MTGAAATTLWARAFVDELARAGVSDVIVAPGSRSTPLVMAFAADGRFRMRVHLDERSGAFFALGMGKASGRPAAMVTTSGTATANVFPAVIEASLGEAPLLVLTADRPHHLRDSDANQAIDQVGLYGSYPRECFELGLPSIEDAALRHLRSVASRAVAAATRPPAGPVHVNFPFDKPLEPVDTGPDGTGDSVGVAGRPDGRPFVEVSAPIGEAPVRVLAPLVEALGVGRGVIVAGPAADASRVGPAAIALAAATGFPILADPLSGARYGPSGSADVVAAYDLFLRDGAVREALAPEVVLRVGATPTSAPLQRWLQHYEHVRHIVIDSGGRWKDHGATATDYVVTDAATALSWLSGRVGRTADDDWREKWRAASVAALEAVDEAGGPHEGDILAAVSASMPAGANLFVSGSMPVRDLDAFGAPREEPLAVYGNRGASGIDGIVSTAFGVAAASDEPTVCVIGDIALFHDQNGLLWSREADCPVVFVLVDNDGGGIFHMLPISEHDPAFTDFFATPHGLDFRHMAEQHDLPYWDGDATGLPDALRDAIASRQASILRVGSDRHENQRRHDEVAESVARRAREALR